MLHHYPVKNQPESSNSILRADYECRITIDFLFCLHSFNLIRNFFLYCILYHKVVYLIGSLDRNNLFMGQLLDIGTLCQYCGIFSDWNIFQQERKLAWNSYIVCGP